MVSFYHKVENALQAIKSLEEHTAIGVLRLEDSFLRSRLAVLHPPGYTHEEMYSATHMLRSNGFEMADENPISLSDAEVEDAMSNAPDSGGFIAIYEYEWSHTNYDDE